MKKQIKHLIKRGVTKVAPSLLETRRRLTDIEEGIRGLQATLNADIAGRDSRLDDLKKLTKQIEAYQPAYGVQGVVDNPQRDSLDRCVVIENALRPIPGKRILDIGSSFGYVSFYFGDRGAVAEGWDMHALNVEISQRIGDINGVTAKFRTNELTSVTVQTIQPGQYDAIIVLSVFHHIIRFQGLKQTQQIVKELFDKAPAMVVELARKGEDPALPWDESQPKDELAIFDLVKDDVTIKKIGEFPNHLSDKTRPLYLVQRKKTVTVNSKVYAYERATGEAYKDSPVSRYGGIVRRYYFGKEHIIKEYLFNAQSFDDNVVQILNEVNLLSHVVPGRVKNAPVLVDFEVSRERARIVLKREEGDLVDSLDLQGAIGRVRSLAKDVLKVLADLEGLNLHHNDVRTWNIILGSDNKARLIDYGTTSVLKTEDDAVALLWVIDALLRGQRETPHDSDALPDSRMFTDATLHALYQAVKKGERSPARLLEAITKHGADTAPKKK